jgi:hypothetical protein
MKKGFNKKIFFGIFGILIIPIFLCTFFINKIHASKIVSVGSSEVLNQTYIGAGDFIDIKGTINGDTILVGNSISFSGNINGNLLAMGNSISIKGRVDGTIIALGSNINISSLEANTLIAGGNFINNIDSRIENNLYLFGTSVSVSGDTFVNRDLMAFGNVIDIKALVNRDLNVGSNTLSFNSTVNRNARIDASSIYYNSGSIKGNLERNSNAKISGQEGNFVNGELSLFQSNINNKISYKFDFFAKLFSKIIFTFFASLIVGFIIIKYFEKLILKLNKQGEENTLKNIGSGLLVLFLVPVAAILIAFTVIGLKLSFLLVGILCMATFFATILSSIFFGDLILRKLFKIKKPSLYLGFLLGLVLIIILMVTPYIGWLVCLSVTSFGIGSIILLEKYILEIVTKSIK